MATSSPTPAKDTIYIDVDDEITGIIDKLRASDNKIVALVLPKRASVLQSIVNMKLLKRAADDAKKNLVLITTESGLMPLAGLAGVHVAPNANAKPVIPAGPQAFDEREETVDEETGEDMADDAKADGEKPVGELAGLGASAAVAEDMETIELDDEAEAPEEAAAVVAAKPPKKSKNKKDKKLAVPNFERFRLLLLLGGVALVALIVGIIVCVSVLPKATISVTTDATNVNANVNLTANTQQNTLNTAGNVLPAKLVQQQKTYTQTTPATGQKNTGDKAMGSVVFYNCDKNDQLYAQNEVIPAGTGLSYNGMTYITQSTASVPPSSYKQDGSCRQNANSTPIQIVAQSGGASYNTDDHTNMSVNYANPSYPGDGKTFSAQTSGAVVGGTDSITKVISQTDIDTAKAKISTNDSAVKQALQTQLTQSGLYPILVTYTAGTPTSTTSGNVGDAADSVSVTETINYSMFGVQQSDLKTVIDTNVKAQIDSSKQSILDEGLPKATFTQSNSTATTAQLTLQTVAVAGPELSADSIKQQVAGKKAGDVKTQLTNDPDVTNVTVKLSPFFVTSVPKKSSRITVNIAKPTVTTSQNASSNP